MGDKNSYETYSHSNTHHTVTFADGATCEVHGPWWLVAEMAEARVNRKRLARAVRAIESAADGAREATRSLLTAVELLDDR